MNRLLLGLVISFTLWLAGMGQTQTALALSNGENVAERAESYVGDAITSTSGGFVSFVFQKEGVSVPHSLAELHQIGTPVEGALAPGDILVFGSDANQLLAAGIYIGNDQFVVSYKPYKTIKSMSLQSTAAQQNYLGARRLYDSDLDLADAPFGKALATKSEEYLGLQVSGYDSGDFVSYVYKESGMPVSSSLSELYQRGRTISDPKDLIPGDLLFFRNQAGHFLAAGFYTGNDRLTVAYGPYEQVKELSLSSDPAQNYFAGARRMNPSNTEMSYRPLNKPHVILAGLEYWGIPYEFGSDRSDTSMMDCSEFVRWAYWDALQIQLPSNSRTQGAYVKENGYYETDWRNLKPGDILFFMSYKGSSASHYENIDKSAERITHNGIYLGNGKILHTYSVSSGGVRIDTLEGKHWEWRFLFGGSVVK